MDKKSCEKPSEEFVKKIYFKKLKGLNDVTINFDKYMTAIMGVNGSGKTTVIHALACLYSNNHAYRFSFFFTPTTDSTWKDSKFEATLAKDYDDINTEYTIICSKMKDRWTPRISKRPLRNIVYIGIDTCTPEIEMRNSVSIIKYDSKKLENDEDKKILKEASYVLNKNYDALFQNEIQNKDKLLGVEIRNGVKYSSLSMGAGEQRVFKILKKLHEAAFNSLILIDEVDLLLHYCAIPKLLEKIYAIAKKKHLQVVFTTHSLAVKEYNNLLIQYIDMYYDVNNIPKMTVFSGLTYDVVHGITNKTDDRGVIYVEDEFSKCIIQYILKKNKITKKFDIKVFGSSDNGFSIAASFVLKDVNTNKEIVVLDGDVYISREDKENKMKKYISGDDPNIICKIPNAVNYIYQYNLPNNEKPEHFMWTLLKKYGDINSDVYKEALRIEFVSDSHAYINNIAKELNYEINEVIYEIIGQICESPEWYEYIKDIQEWIITANV